MKPEIKLYPESSKQMLLSLFTKFFQDHLLTSEEFAKDRKTYEKNYDTWQRFIKIINQEDSVNGGDNQNIQKLTNQMQDLLKSICSNRSTISPYLEEINTIINQTKGGQQDSLQQNPSITTHLIERAKSQNSKRQFSIPPKPTILKGDNVVEEENNIYDYIYKSGQSIRTPKKSHTSGVNINKHKQIKEVGDLNITSKKHNHSTFEALNISKSIDSSNLVSNFSSSIKQKEMQLKSFNCLNHSNQNACNSQLDAVDISQGDVIELIDFLNQKNTKNFKENVSNLMKENSFKEKQTAFIYKSLLSNHNQEKLSMMDQFLFAISIAHYQDLFQNHSEEKWENVFQLISEQKQSISERDRLRSDSDPTNKMTFHQAQLMNTIFSEIHERILLNKDTPQQIFSEFLKKTQVDEQFAQCLQTSLKEQIIAACKLNENQSFRKDIFNNWFVKNPNTSMLGIDSQKLKLLSYSLKKKIAILKVTQTINLQKQIQSTTSLEVLQSFDSPINSSQVSTLNILWHSSHNTNNFFVILNESQKSFYVNKVQQKKDSKSPNPLIQIREISLQKCISDQYPNSRMSSPNSHSPFLTSTQHKQSLDSEHINQSSTLSSLHLQSSISKTSQTKSPFPKVDNYLIEKYSTQSAFSKSATSTEPGFTNEALVKLKEKSQKLKLMMIDNSFSINSLQLQLEKNWTPIKQNNHLNIIQSPSLQYLQLLNSNKSNDQAQLTQNSAQPLLKQYPDYEPISQLKQNNSINQIQILGNQQILGDESKRGREFSQPQIKLLNQYNMRSASQNHLFKYKEEQSMISLITSTTTQNKHIVSITQIPNNQRIQQQVQPEIKARLRVQSGHVGSVGMLSDDSDYPGISLLASNNNHGLITSKNCQPQVNNQLSEGSSNSQISKNEENKIDESSEKRLGYHLHNGSQPQIQLLNKYLPNNQNLMSSDDNEKNILKLLGLTHSTSTATNSTSASNTTSTNNTPCNYVQNNPTSRQASFFSRNTNNNLNSQSLEQGIKLIKSISTNQNVKPPTHGNSMSIPSINDFKFYQDFSYLNKLGTPQSLKNQSINQRGILLQQNVVIS